MLKKIISLILFSVIPSCGPYVFSLPKSQNAQPNNTQQTIMSKKKSLHFSWYCHFTKGHRVCSPLPPQNTQPCRTRDRPCTTQTHIPPLPFFVPYMQHSIKNLSDSAKYVLRYWLYTNTHPPQIVTPCIVLSFLFAKEQDSEHTLRQTNHLLLRSGYIWPYPSNIRCSILHPFLYNPTTDSHRP